MFLFADATYEPTDSSVDYKPPVIPPNRTYTRPPNDIDGMHNHSDSLLSIVSPLDPTYFFYQICVISPGFPKTSPKCPQSFKHNYMYIKILKSTYTYLFIEAQ